MTRRTKRAVEFVPSLLEAPGGPLAISVDAVAQRAWKAGSLDAQEMKELAALKQAFVLRDLAGYGEVTTRIHTVIIGLRTLQLAITSAVLAVAKSLPDWKAFTLVVVAWLMFLVLENDQRTFLKYTDEEAARRNLLLSAASPAEFNRVLAAWTFGNPKLATLTKKQRLRRMFSVPHLFKPGVAPWHLSLLTLLILMVLFTR